ncbi:MAG: magnesium transporter CorA family protein [Patescibacteria group bacterium]|nr:magnesium transporter CorA family protein [bacterium]MDZ4221854.1 magnesium transporter CorA family protein [Patescibacteria group bacterium]
MKSITHNKITWRHFDDNSTATIKALEKDFEFHKLDMEDVSSGPQQPKTDFYKNYLFAIFHFPGYNKEEERIHVFELDVFLGPDYVITVSKGDSGALKDICSQIENDDEFREEMMGEGAGFFLYKLVDALTETSWSVIRKISSQMGDIEEEIYSEETGKRTVWRIALIRRNLIRLRRILNPQLVVLASLVHADMPYLKKELSLYFDDVQDTLNRLQAITSGNVEVMNTLHNVNESLISQRTNEVIKLLTLISVSLLPMTLLTGFYGMNVEALPFVGHPNIVWLIFGALFAIILVFLVIFKRKDWV